MKFFIQILILTLALTPAAGTPVFGVEANPPEAQEALYQCSMHPWITSDKPGNCPVCGMKLTRIKSSEAKGDSLENRAPVEINPGLQQLIGVTQSEAAERELIYTVHSVGHVAYNPDIATMLAEYREAYGAFRKSRVSSNVQIRERAMELMEIADLRLRLSGMSSEQVNQIRDASFDTRVLKGSFAPENLILPEGSVWVDTDVYEADSEMLKPGQKVFMTSPVLPGKTFEGAVKIADALLNEYPRKVRARIETPHENVLKDGMSMDVLIKVSLGKKLSVPESAVLDSGHTKTVFVETKPGSFEPREVEIGYQADGYFEIVSGLHPGEKLVTSASFLIDSESRLRAAAQGFSKSATPAAGGHSHD